MKFADLMRAITPQVRSFTTGLEVAISPEVHTAFDNVYNDVVKPHPACKHDLFTYIADVADKKGLTSEQMARYRHSMFSRVFTTVPTLFEYGKQAALQADYRTLATVVQNIKEECAEGKSPLMHPVLMQNTFNALGQVFGLAPVTMKACFDTPKLPESLMYRYTVAELYRTCGPLVSYMQEYASGGDNSPRNPGMMGDMHRLFYSYRHQVSNPLFMRYFAEHITLDPGTGKQVFKGEAVEFQHGQRAKEDVLRLFKTPDDVERTIPYMLSFLESQKLFFDAIQRDIEKGAAIGMPVRPQKKTAEIIALPSFRERIIAGRNDGKQLVR